MAEQRPSFREWQLSHAMRCDPLRWWRLQIRWAHRDLVLGLSAVLTEVVRSATAAMTAFAETFRSIQAITHPDSITEGDHP